MKSGKIVNYTFQFDLFIPGKFPFQGNPDKGGFCDPTTFSRPGKLLIQGFIDQDIYSLRFPMTFWIPVTPQMLFQRNQVMDKMGLIEEIWWRISKKSFN